MVFNENEKRELNNKVRSFKEQGIVSKNIGTLISPIPMTIETVSLHAKERLAAHGITKKDAQSYIDNAMAMFEQGKGTRYLYISGDGNAAALVEGSELITAYPSYAFDDGIKCLIAEVKKYE
jgi:hypothetical protein